MSAKFQILLPVDFPCTSNSDIVSKVPRELAIVLSDGSLSATLAATLAQQKYRLVLARIVMGDLKRARSADAFDRQVVHFKPYRHHTLSVETPKKQGGRDAAHMIDPRAHDDLGHRLTTLLPVMAIGFQLAAHYEANSVHIGLRVGRDSADLARASEHVQIWNELVQMTCGRPTIELIAPVLELERWQVVDLGFQAEAPMALSWDCDTDQPEPCGTCGGCREREQAFLRSARADPTRVAAAPVTSATSR